MVMGFLTARQNRCDGKICTRSEYESYERPLPKTYTSSEMGGLHAREQRPWVVRKQGSSLGMASPMRVLVATLHRILKQPPRYALAYLPLSLSGAAASINLQISRVRMINTVDATCRVHCRHRSRQDAVSSRLVQM